MHVLTVAVSLMGHLQFQNDSVQMQNGVLQPATSQQVKFYVFLVSTGAKLLL
jgi:hypothetical protein